MGLVAFLTLTLTLAASGLQAQAVPGDWLTLQTPSIGNAVELGSTVSEKKNVGAFRHDRDVFFDASLAVAKYFAVEAGGGYLERRRTDLETARVRDRWSLGFLVANSNGYEEGQLAFSYSLRLYSKQAKPIPSGEDPELYLARTIFSLGLRTGMMEWIAEVGLQSETNSSFRENEEQQFRRQYEAGLGAAARLGDSWRALLELRYVAPYNPEIDGASRSFRALPGLAWRPGHNAELYVQGVFALRLEAELDRGLRVGTFISW